MKRAPIGRPKSRKARVLFDALVAAGHTKVRLWWEPMGPALEMCGNSGGYLFESHELGGPFPIGLSLEQALKSVAHHPPAGRGRRG